MKAGILVGALSMTTVFVTPVQASNIMETIDLETNEDFAEDTSYSLLRGNNLSHGTVKISKLSNHEIAIYGITQCHRECDEVWLDLALEQKVDGGYGTYKIWSYKTTNATSLSKGLNVLVPKNHYYRVRGYHAAKDGSKESTTTLTSGIWIGD